MSDWISVCHKYAEEQGISSRCAVLHAFGGRQVHTDMTNVDFFALHTMATKLISTIKKDIVSNVSQEVDRPQAKMFANRFVAVVEILQRDSHPAGKMFLVGLIARIQQILLRGDNLALRIRAIVDFYYSQGAMLRYCNDQSPDSISSLLEQASWSRIETGVVHCKLQGVTKKGPIHINVLRVKGRKIWTGDFRDLPGSFSSQLKSISCLHGVSGGFFLYSEPDIVAPARRGDPVGLLVSKGTIGAPPTFRRGALLQHQDGRLEIRRVGMDEISIVLPSGVDLPIYSTNNLAPLGRGICCFNRAFGSISPPFKGTTVAFSGRTIMHKSQKQLPIPLSGFVLCIPETVDFCFAEGMQISYKFSNGDAIVSAMAGGPILLHPEHPTLNLTAEDFAQTAPPITFSQDETFDQNLLPRMGVGITADQELIFAAVDGRNFEHSLGMTLHDLADLLAKLGCVVGLNLDGGSSKRMVIDGSIVDLPSTGIETTISSDKKVRPIRSGIAILPMEH